LWLRENGGDAGGGGGDVVFACDREKCGKGIEVEAGDWGVGDRVDKLEKQV